MTQEMLDRVPGLLRPTKALSRRGKRSFLRHTRQENLPPRPFAPSKEADPSPAPPGTAGNSADDGGTTRRPSVVRRHRFMTASAVALLTVLVAGGYLYWDYARHFEDTDDAFIAARQFPIAPKVSGYIASVAVTDNQHVNAGDVLARIDDRDFKTALAQASAQVAAAQASIQSIDAQITLQASRIAQNQAQLELAQAALVFAGQQSTRYADLSRQGATSVQSAQQKSSELQQQQAAVRSAQAALEATQRQLPALQAQRDNAEAALNEAAARREQAELNLSYTVITAAQPGRVVALTVATGQYVAPGTSLSMFVPDEIWVVANFKETQLAAMRPGQPVTLQIDAYPQHAVRGHVESVQPGSGTAFSLLPAENATGNYVKITQRVPVKLIIDNPPADVAVGPGMSVEPTVRVDPTPALVERLDAWL